MDKLSPEELQVLLEMIMQGQQAGVEDDILQKDYASAIRGPDELRMRGNSRLQVAPSVLEGLGGLSQDYVGDLQKEKATQKRRELATKTGSQNQRLLEILSKTMGNDPTPPVPVDSGMFFNGLNPTAPAGVGGIRMPRGNPDASGMVSPFQMG